MLQLLTRTEYVPDPPPVWVVRSRPRKGGTLLKLAPGVYIVRFSQWQPASVLDTNADLPILIPDTPARQLPHPAWHQRAACRSLDDSLFFGDDSGARPALRRSVLARARKVCWGECIETATCLTHALTEPERYGIWGGTSGRQREQLQELIGERVKAGEARSEVIRELVEGALHGRR